MVEKKKKHKRAHTRLLPFNGIKIAPCLAAIFGSLETLNDCSLTREAYTPGMHIPDWLDHADMPSSLYLPFLMHCLNFGRGLGPVIRLQVRTCQFSLLFEFCLRMRYCYFCANLYLSVFSGI